MIYFGHKRQSRVFAKEMWGPTDRNKDNGGVYNLGATYKTPVGLELKLYGLYADDVFSALGAKAKYSTKIKDGEFGGTLHIMHKVMRKIIVLMERCLKQLFLLR